MRVAFLFTILACFVHSVDYQMVASNECGPKVRMLPLMPGPDAYGDSSKDFAAGCATQVMMNFGCGAYFVVETNMAGGLGIGCQCVMKGQDCSPANQVPSLTKTLWSISIFDAEEIFGFPMKGDGLPDVPPQWPVDA